jgi:hypothetical protein
MKNYIALSLLVFLVACSTEKTEEKKPALGTLTRTLQMVDEDGRRFGTVELDPVGGGKLFDNDGRVIGRVTAPQK